MMADIVERVVLNFGQIIRGGVVIYHYDNRTIMESETIEPAVRAIAQEMFPGNFA